MALTKVVKHLSSTPSIVDGGNATAITIESSENVVLSEDLRINDSKNLYFGNDNDAQLYYNSSNDIFYIYNGGASGGTIIQNNSAAGGITLQPVPNENAVHCGPNGAVQIYHDGSSKLQTTSTGVNVTGTITGALASTVTGTTQSAGTNNTTIATTAYTDAAITALIGGAPSTLDTLNEIAASINDDANYVGTVNNLIAAKAPLDSPVFSSTYTGGQDESLAEFRRDGGAVAAKIIYADATTDMEFGTTTSHAISLITDDTRRIKIDNAGDVNIGALAIASATTAPLMVAKASTDVQAIFGDNNASIDDPSIRIIGRNTANNAVRYTFLGLDADANHGYLGYNAGAGGFVNALKFDTSGRVGINQTPLTNNFALQVTGLGGGSGDARAVYLKGSGAHTSIGSTGPTLTLQNTNNTANNIVKLSFESASSGETVSINAINTAHSSHYGDMAFNTRGSAGYSEKLRITSNGEIRVQNQTLVDSANTNHIMIFPNNKGISIGSAYTYGEFNANNGNVYIRANSYPANTGSESLIYLQTANSSGGQSSDVVVKGGKVGIGETSPLTKLHVTGGTSSGTVYNTAIFAGGQNSTSGSGARIWLTGCENDPLARGTVIEGISTNNSNAHALVFKTSASSSAPTERMRIDSVGRVGIATTTNHAGSALGYGLTIDSAGYSGSGLEIHRTGNSRFELYQNSTGGQYLDALGSTPFMVLSTGGTERMRINSTGLTLTGKVTAGATDSEFYNRLFIKNGNDGIYMGQWDGSNHRIEADASRPLSIQAYNSNGIYFGLAGNTKVQIVGAQLKLNTDIDLVQTVSSGGGDYHYITHSGNEAWSWGARSGSGSDDYLDVGISGGTKAMSWHENGKVMVGPSTTATSGAKLEVRGFNETEDATDSDDATGAEEPILMLRGANGGSVQEWVHSTKAVAPSGGTQTAMTSWYRFDLPGGWSGTGTPGFLEIHNQVSGMHASGSAVEKFFLNLPNEHGNIASAGGLQNTSISRWYAYTANVGAYTTSLSTSFYYGNASSFGYAGGAIFMKVVHASREPIFTMYAKYIGGTGSSRNYPQKLHFLGTESTNNHQPSNVSSLSVHDGRGIL